MFDTRSLRNDLDLFGIQSRQKVDRPQVTGQLVRIYQVLHFLRFGAERDTYNCGCHGRKRDQSDTLTFNTRRRMITAATTISAPNSKLRTASGM